MWYHDLLAGLRVRGRAEAIKRGDSVKDTTLGIRHKLLFRICKYLCKVRSRRSIQERAILTIPYIMQSAVVAKWQHAISLSYDEMTMR